MTTNYFMKTTQTRKENAFVFNASNINSQRAGFIHVIIVVTMYSVDADFKIKQRLISIIFAHIYYKKQGEFTL